MESKYLQNFSFIPKIFPIILAGIFLFGCVDPNQKGVVSSASPEATQVGVKILEEGGNAIDAAIAISFALGVTEPAMSGLGGGSQLLVALPDELPFLINGTTYAPVLTDPRISSDSLTYHKRSTIPSTVKVLSYAWKKYGSGNLSWEQLLSPAIELARDGFVVGQFRAEVYKMYEKSMTTSPYSTALWLKPGNITPTVGDRIVQPILARTLERLAEYGADDFYNGEIANAISKDMEDNQGWIRKDDLANFPEPEELPALHIAFKDYDVYSMPPPGAGYAVLQILKLYEKLESNNQDTPPHELWAKSLKAIHTDRDRNPLLDMNNYQNEINDKLSDDYLDQINSQQTATDTVDVGGETTHFSVVDKHGMAVAVTASINAYFGAKAASSELGFLYNSYMDDFEFENPSHPAAIRPGAMAFSSMSPTIVKKDGKNVLIVGSPGSKRIISTVAQVVASWISERDIEGAVNQKRFHTSGKSLYVEDLTLADNLESKGLEGFRIRKANDNLLRNGLNAYYGGVHAIGLQNNSWVGAADPRRDGTVGYTKD